MSATLDQPLFELTIRPYRSLTLRGMRLVMVLVACASFVASLPFVILGFWPVAGFYGLDILLLYLAFRSNFKAARQHEEVRISPFELLLRKVNSDGKTAEWRFNPLWTRLEAEKHDEFGVLNLAFVSRGQSVPIGQFLGSEEKSTLLSGLSKALSEAKRGPYFS
jgi:uncharacterized membrane protein